jgi:uncharacterized protein (DUF2141 family)
MRYFVFIKTMRWSLLACLLLGNLGLMVDAGAEDKVRLQLTIDGVQQAQGHIIVGLFACEESYDQGDHPSYHVLLPAEPRDGKVKYIFNDLPAGTYAIKLFHDINDNQKLDSNWLGIPREPYGFSNNPRVRFGPPDFSATHFVLLPGQTAKQVVVLN